MPIDLEIRRNSAGKKTLDDLMRAVIKRFPPDSGGYDTEEIRKTLEETTGMSWAKFFSDYVYGAKELPLENTGRLYGMETESAESKDFDLGFEVDTSEIRKDSKVVAVNPGSNAEKAGIKVGDQFIGGGGRMTTEKRSTLKFLRMGREVTLTYFPLKITPYLKWASKPGSMKVMEMLKGRSSLGKSSR